MASTNKFYNVHLAEFNKINKKLNKFLIVDNIIRPRYIEINLIKDYQEEYIKDM